MRNAFVAVPLRRWRERICANFAMMELQTRSLPPQIKYCVPGIPRNSGGDNTVVTGSGPDFHQLQTDRSDTMGSDFIKKVRRVGRKTDYCNHVPFPFGS